MFDPFQISSVDQLEGPQGLGMEKPWKQTVTHVVVGSPLPLPP